MQSSIAKRSFRAPMMSVTAVKLGWHMLAAAILAQYEQNKGHMREILPLPTWINECFEWG